MLYITTRANNDAFTAYRAMSADIAPDGGRYVPFRLPHYGAAEIISMKEKSFGEIVAELLNAFFSSRLTGWDVDFCIGRNVSRLIPMNHRIIVAELWHNPKASYCYIVESLHSRILNTAEAVSAPTDWVKIAVRIAVLFGLYSDLLKNDLVAFEQPIDVSVPSEDFTAPMAAWYARKMGLPIGTIICTCEENSTVWDLIHRGVFNTVATPPDLQLGVERLIHATLGFDEVRRYCKQCEKGQSYTVAEEALVSLSDGLFCAVVGDTRSGSTINSVFRSNSYIIDPFTALCYGGLQDYRARTGGSRTTLLFAERTPLDFGAEIAGATGIPAEKLVDHVNLS